MHLAPWPARLVLLAKKADPNLANRREFTPLHLAAGKGAKPVVEMLVAAGANPRAKGPNGASPMHMAALEGKTDVVLFFLAKGLDINLPDEKTQGPIFYAATGGHTELVKVLLDRKAAIRGTGLMADEAGTPLHDAAAAAHRDHGPRCPARGVPLRPRSSGGRRWRSRPTRDRSRP